MSAIRDYVEIETWSIRDLIDAVSKDPVGKKRITIPEFQRRLVWSKDKQEELINSIKKGYPFGSLLLYEHTDGSASIGDSKKHYNLIDGLQRTHALKRYTDNPNSFFSKDDVDESYIKNVARYLGNSSEEFRDSILRETVKWVKQIRGFSETAGWGTAGLTSALVSEVLKVERDSNEFFLNTGKFQQNGLFRNTLEHFLQSIREQADINAVRIPIIIYTGPDSELPEVFEKLNTQGTSLSRYEVFAAKWIDPSHRQRIGNKKIIEAIWKKYEALEDESFTSDVSQEAPDMQSRIKRKYTLFEYLFGFGQYLADEFPRLFKAIADDRPSSGGFNLMCACSDLAIKDMGKLQEHLSGIEREKLEACILESTTFVDELLNSVLSVKQHRRSKTSIYHTEYQIISIIATAFKVRYELRELSEIDGWRSNRRRLKKHVLMYYLYDILRDQWRGSGDTKLYDAVQNERYLNNPPSERSWKQTLEDWFVDNQIPLVHKGRYVRDDNPEFLLLKYIYAHKLSVIANAKTYHVEHVIPVNQLMSLKKDDDEKLAFNAVSNLALLGQADNSKKGDLTFVEYLNQQREKINLKDKEYEKELARYEEQLLCPRHLLPSKLTKSSYDSFLTDRFEFLKSEFIRAWRDYIPSDPEN